MSTSLPRRYFRALLVAAGLACIALCHAQENPQRVDSILPLLDPLVKDTDQVNMLIMMAESWSTSEKAVPYLQRLDALSAELLHDPDVAVQHNARHARGALHFFRGYHAKFARNVPLALHSFQSAITEFSALGEKHALGEAYDGLGVLFLAVGDLDQAQAAFTDELRLARELRHAHLNVQALVHLAAVRAQRNDLIGAEAYLDSCGKGNAADSSAVLNERAEILRQQGRTRDAIAVLITSLGMSQRTDNPWDQLPVLAPLARAHFAVGEHREGVAYAQQCAQVAGDMGDEVARCGCMILAGSGELAMGDERAGENDLLQGLELAKANNNVGVAREMGDEGSMVHAAELLKDLYRHQQRTADALAMTERWIVLRDSVARMDGRSDLMTFEFQKQLLRDSLSRSAAMGLERAQHEQQLTSERNRRYLLWVIIGGAALLVLGIWSRLRLVRRTRDAILAAQARLVQSEKSREAEEVRTRIARDVHDDLGSDLTKLALLSSEAKRIADGGSGALMGVIDRIGGLSRVASASLSDIVWAVDPAQDTVAELVRHAHTYTLRMLDGTGIRSDLNFMAKDIDRPIDPATKRDIFLLLKEALNNALRHAHAARIDVELVTDDAGFHLLVRDDGRGYSAGAIVEGNGTRSMRARAERLGATWACTTSPGHGCTIAVHGPVA